MADVKDTLKRLFDRKRCRYMDCAEQHPVASDDEQVTCPTCREGLGLEAV